MDIAAALASATAALDIAKGLRAVEKSYDLVELKMQVIDLIDKLVDVKGALQDAREALADREQQIAGLVSAAAVRAETIVYSNGFRYEVHPEEPHTPRGSPFCQFCDEQHGKLVRTIDNPKVIRHIGLMDRAGGVAPATAFRVDGAPPVH